MASITVGCDPEIFIKEKDTGAPIPICGLLGGTKEAPVDVGGYGVQEDNVMAEYNTPPSSDPMRFANHVRNGRDAVKNVLSSRFPDRFEFDLAPSRLFSHQLLAVPQAAVFGCSPDFDAYSLGQANPRIERAQLQSARGEWRFCGGHVHIGYAHALKEEVPPYVAAQFADVFLGLPLVRYDGQGERRKFYGTPGRYRPTSYGIEYRTLSNTWTYTADMCELVADQAIRLGGFLTRKSTVVKRLWGEIPWVDVRRAISSEDAALAATLLSYCNSLKSMEV